MKKILISTFLAVALFGVLLNSCTKEQFNRGDGSVPEGLIQEAKDWHYEQTHNPASSSNRINNENRLILTPKFAQAKLKTFASGREILYTPAMDFDLKNSKIAMLRGFVFEVRQNKIASGKIVEIYGSVDFITHHKGDLLTKYVEKQLGDFNGNIITYDVNYKYIYGFVYENGKRIAAQSALGYKVTGDDKQISSGRALDEECYEVYYIIYYSDGSEEWTYLYGYCTSSGNGENPGGGAGGGGSSGDPNPVNVEIVENDLTTPCLISQVENLRDANFQGQIHDIFNSVFDSDGSPGNVTFSEVNNPASDDPAQTFLVDDAPISVRTVLNSSILSRASQEYTTIVIYHEMAHEILYALGDQDALQHAEILQSYVNEIAAVGQNLFPNLPQQDARALALVGLKDIVGTPAFNQALTNFQLTLDQVKQIGKAYRRDTDVPANQLKGSPCN